MNILKKTVLHLPGLIFSNDINTVQIATHFCLLKIDQVTPMLFNKILDKLLIEH